MFREKCISPNGLHVIGQGAKCHMCGLVDEELAQQIAAHHEAQIESGARKVYQAEVKGVALSLLNLFMQQNMIRDMGAVMRDANTIKAPTALTDMLDNSIAGAIHFVGEVSKLKPSQKYVEEFAKRMAAGLPDITPYGIE